MWYEDLNYTYSILVFLCGILYPLHALSSAKKARQILLDHPESKAEIYKGSIAVQWIFTLIVLLAMWYYQDDFSRIGAQFIFHPLGIISIVGIYLLMTLGAKSLIQVQEKDIPKLTKRYRDVLYITPSTAEDYKWSLWMSFTAGFCEEIIFRGFFFWQLSQVLPLIPAILLVNFLFSIAHASTKLKNMLYAFLLGLFWSALFYFTGSLWWAILMHIAVDVFSVSQSYGLVSAKKGM